MKTLVFLLLSSVVLLSFSTEQAAKYFEGEITFDIEYDSHIPNLTKESLKALHGATMVLSFKKGNSCKRFYNEDGVLVSERMLDLKKGISFSKGVASDTVTWFDVTENDSNGVFSIGRDTLINDNKCIVVDQVAKLEADWVEEKFRNVKLQYVFAKNLKVNPSWFKNYKEGNFNEIMAVNPFIALETHFMIWAYDTHMKARKIDIKKINKRDLTIDISGLPLKQI